MHYAAETKRLKTVAEAKQDARSTCGKEKDDIHTFWYYERLKLLCAYRDFVFHGIGYLLYEEIVANKTL